MPKYYHIYIWHGDTTVYDYSMEKRYDKNCERYQFEYCQYVKGVGDSRGNCWPNIVSADENHPGSKNKVIQFCHLSLLVYFLDTFLSNEFNLHWLSYHKFIS